MKKMTVFTLTLLVVSLISFQTTLAQVTLEHGSSVTSVAFSPDGTLLASGNRGYKDNDNNKVKLWDLETKQNIATLEGHYAGVSSVAFSPDGAILASGSYDNTVKLWDLETKQNIATLEGDGRGATSVAFSPDGTLLASAASNNEIKLWDTATYTSTATLEEDWNVDITSVAFSPDGTFLASGDDDGWVKFWDVSSHENTATFRGHGGSIISVVFSHDGALLASTAGDEAKLWNVATKENIVTLGGWTRAIASISFSSDGTLFASGGDTTLFDVGVKLWDMETKKVIAELEGHRDDVTSVAFSPDGTLLASGSSDDTVKLWNIAEWTSTLQIISGNRQKGVINTQLVEPFVVEAKDRYDSPLSDVQVTFKVTKGEGLLSGKSQVVEVTTDTNGRAAQPLTLGPHVGTNIVEVSIANSVVTFNASGISPYQLEIISGDHQHGQFGSALAQPLVVEVRDWQGNLLPDTQVTFGVYEGDALLNGESKIVEVTTDANGRAAQTLVLGNTIENSVVVSIGPETVSFSVTGNSSSYSNTFSSSEDGPPAAALSPDGKTIAISFSYTNTVELWDVETHTNIATLEGHTNYIWSVAFSPDGTLFATGSEDNTVKLWDVETHTNIATLEGQAAHITSVAFSPDSMLLASGAWDGIVKVWNVDTQENIATFGGHDADTLNNWFRGWYAPVAFSPDGTTLVYGASDEIKFWDVATKQEIATIVAHPDGVISLSFSSDGTLLASNSADVIKLWNVETHENIPTSIPEIDDGIIPIAFSPNSTILAYTYPPHVVLWDVKEDMPIANLEGHTNLVWSLSFSSDGTLLASASADGTVKLWDMAESKLPRPSHLVKISGDAQQGWLGVPLPKPLVVEVRDQYDNPFPGAQVTFRVTEGGGKLNGQSKVERVTTDANGKAAISLTLGHTKINSAEVSLVGTGFVGNPRVRFSTIISPYYVASLEAHKDVVHSVLFSPDGTLLASGSDDETVKLWDVETHTNVTTLWHRDILSVAFSPDGKTLASGDNSSSGPTVKLWDVETKQNIATLERQIGTVTSVAFSPDGKTLASGLYGHSVKLWDVETKQNIATLVGDSWDSTSVVFSPDSTLLASASGNKIKLWDVATHTNIATLEEDRHVDITSVVFSPDGTLLASGNDRRTVKLWDVDTKQNIATLEGHADDVNSVAFSPDGTLLASGSDDDTVKLWDVETKENITTFEGYTGNVSSIAFSPNGMLLASGTGNGTVELWDISSFITSTTPPESLKEDVNGDGVVTMADLVLVASNYGQTGPNVADINGDGVVHIYDIILVASQIDTDAAAPSLRAKDLSTLTAADVKQWLSEAQQLGLTDAISLRGILFLEQLLAALTIPKETALLPNYPNPFNPETWIPFQLAKDADVTLHIYAVNGTLVRTLALGHQPAGIYRSRSRAAYWDGQNKFGESVASGVYFYTLTAGNFSATRKMLIRK